MILLNWFSILFTRILSRLWSCAEEVGNLFQLNDISLSEMWREFFTTRCPFGFVLRPAIDLRASRIPALAPSFTFNSPSTYGQNYCFIAFFLFCFAVWLLVRLLSTYFIINSLHRPQYAKAWIPQIRFALNNLQIYDQLELINQTEKDFDAMPSSERLRIKLILLQVCENLNPNSSCTSLRFTSDLLAGQKHNEAREFLEEISSMIREERKWNECELPTKSFFYWMSIRFGFVCTFQRASYLNICITPEGNEYFVTPNMCATAQRNSPRM